MKTLSENIGIFIKSIWNGVLGIFTEIALACIFILAGLAVCLAWWFIFFR